ncbi:MAG: PAS domain S-box protein [Saccharospirillum sp.]|nr:PAS domain S-box protein [Saccharospirillum sp.]
MGQRDRYGREDKTELNVGLADPKKRLFMAAIQWPLTTCNSIRDVMNFKTVFDSHPRAMMVTDSEPRIVYVNQVFEKITGYKAERIIGEKPSVLSSGYHDQGFYSVLLEGHSVVSIGHTG